MPNSYFSIHRTAAMKTVGNIESKRHHPGDRQRLIGHDLATPHAQVVYDSEALTISGKSRGGLDNVPLILALIHKTCTHGN